MIGTRGSSMNDRVRRRSNAANRGVLCQLYITLTTTLLVTGCGSTLTRVVGLTFYNVVTDTTNSYRIIQRSALFAGKKGSSSSGSSSSSSNTKSNTRSSNTKGGFGRVAMPRNEVILDGIDNDDDDYKVFPALEPRIRDTLIPAPITDADTLSHIDMEAPLLSSEIHQRLDQIYGFPLFNFHHDHAIVSASSKNTQNDAPLPIQTSPLDMLMSSYANDSTLSNNEDSTEEALPLPELPPFRNVRVLHIDPMILSIDDFFTPEECEKYIQQSETKSLGKKNGGDGIGSSVMQSRSPTVGKDATAKAQRTSTTFYHKYETVPELMSKASRLLGLPTIHQWEEPQTVRYRKNEKFTWHLDALGPTEQQSSSSGQRTATLLVYLTDLTRADGGATLFRDLGNATAVADCKYLRVQPKKGMALLFFPSAGGISDCPFDIRTLHCGEVVSNDAIGDKWIAQLWLRQRSYTPTAPPGNRHGDAYTSIANYCQTYTSKQNT